MMLVPALATALVYGVGGQLAIDGTLDRRHPARAGHPAAAAARPAAGPVQRAHRRDDRAGQLRARLRGARPAVADRRRSRTPSRCRAARRRLEFDHVAFRYPRADEVSLASLEVGRPQASPRDTGAGARTTSVHAPSRARWSRWSARPAPARPRSPTWSPGSTTSTSGAVRVGGHDVRDVTLQSLEDVVGYVTQDAHMFHDTIRANLLYARPGRHRRARSGRRSRPPRSAPLVRGAARRPRHRRRRPRLPALRRRAAAAGHRPAAAQGAADRRARRGDRPPRLRVRGGGAAGARRRARGPHVAGDRAPALDGPQRRPDPGRRRRPGRPARHPRRRCSPQGGLYADLYRTQFIDDRRRGQGLTARVWAWTSN